MQQKIIIYQSPVLPGNLNGLDTAPGILKDLVESLKRFMQETGIAVVDFGKSMNASEFIQETSLSIPNSDRDKQLHFRIDVLNDAKSFDNQIKTRIIEREGGKIGGIKMTESAMMEIIQLPQDLIIEVIEAKRALDSFIYDLPKEQIFWDYLTLEQGKVKVKKNAEIEITERLTTYASTQQQKFLFEASQLLSKLSELEKAYNVPGLVLKASSAEGANYLFNNEHLTQIR